MGEENEKKPVQVTPLSLGVNVRGGITLILIPRNSPIPTKVEKLLYPEVNDQTSCLFRVCMGERARTIDNIVLKEFALSEFPPTPRNALRFKVCLQIDKDGILTVDAQIVPFGMEKGFTFTKVTTKCENIWPEEEVVEEMIRTADECEFEDGMHKEKVEAKNGLLDYAEEFEKKLNNVYVGVDDKKFLLLEMEKLWFAIKKAKSVERVEDIEWIKKEIGIVWDSILFQQSQNKNMKNKKKNKKKVHPLIRVIKSFFRN